MSEKIAEIEHQISALKPPKRRYSFAHRLPVPTAWELRYQRKLAVLEMAKRWEMLRLSATTRTRVTFNVSPKEPSK